MSTQPEDLNTGDKGQRDDDNIKINCNELRHVLDRSFQSSDAVTDRVFKRKDTTLMFFITVECTGDHE